MNSEKNNELVLKELAPYLPYGLNCICHTNYKGGLDIKQAVIAVGETYITYRNTCYQCVDVQFNDIKPVLRPLSHLTQEIEHNGENFVPIQRIRNEFIKIDGSHRHFDYPLTLDGLNCGVLSIPYWVIEKLIEWHFDVFGLIEKGLAVSY